MKCCLSVASSFHFRNEKIAGRRAILRWHFCFFCCQTKEGPRGSENVIDYPVFEFSLRLNQYETKTSPDCFASSACGLGCSENPFA